jgi:hypothetical protein
MHHLNRATCFACFIRSRSGIASSLQSERRPDRVRRYVQDYHANMATAWLISAQPEPIGILAEILVVRRALEVEGEPL